MSQYLKATPLLIFVLAGYFLVAATGAGALDTIVFSGAVPSGGTLALRTGELIVGVGLLVLFFEVIKATRSTIAGMVDQVLSIMLFTVCIVLFLLVRSAATGTFLLLTVMSFVDVLAAFIITVSVSRRDVTIERG